MTKQTSTDENTFIQEYLKPSESRLDNNFTHPLPDIAGLEKRGKFIVQGEFDQTVSTNLISKYFSPSMGIRLIDVYKNTQNINTGIFVRLVGTMCIVKQGFPFLFLDAAITNVSPMTAEKEALTTRVAIHLPQATSKQRKQLFDIFINRANENHISHKELKIDTLPEFWGSLWLAQSEYLDLDLIRNIRDVAATGYIHLAEQTEALDSIDYKLVQKQMIFESANKEHLMFKRMGLNVPVEAQAAFFAVLTGEITSQDA